MDGAASIRTFRQTNCFTERFYSAVYQNSSALLCFVSAQRWLAFRIEILGSLIVLMCSVLVISMNDSHGIDAGLAGLLVSCHAPHHYSKFSLRSRTTITPLYLNQIVWSTIFTITLGFLVDTFRYIPVICVAPALAILCTDLTSPFIYCTVKRRHP